jgi:hypothetical protein
MLVLLLLLLLLLRVAGLPRCLRHVDVEGACNGSRYRARYIVSCYSSVYWPWAGLGACVCVSCGARHQQLVIKVKGCDIYPHTMHRCRQIPHCRVTPVGVCWCDSCDPAAACSRATVRSPHAKLWRTSVCNTLTTTQLLENSRAIAAACRGPCWRSTYTLPFLAGWQALKSCMRLQGKTAFLKASSLHCPRPSCCSVHAGGSDRRSSAKVSEHVPACGHGTCSNSTRITTSPKA